MAQQEISKEEIEAQREKFAYEKNTIPELVYYAGEEKRDGDEKKESTHKRFRTLEELFPAIVMPIDSVVVAGKRQDPKSMGAKYKIFKALIKQHPSLTIKQFGLYYAMFAAKEIDVDTYNDIWTIPLAGFIYANRVEMGYPEGISEQDIGNFITYDRVEELRQEYEIKLVEFRRRMTVQKNKKESLSQIVGTIDMTPHTIVRLFRTYPYNKSVYDVSEFFNISKVTHTIPYLNLGDFYKIHNDVEIYPSWVEQENDPEKIIGYIKTDSSIIPKEASYDLFILGEDTLTVNSTERERFSLQAGNRTINKIQKLFMDKIQIPKISEEKGDDIPYRVLKEDLRIECFYLNTNIHPLVFKHFLYTDPIVRNFFFLDERIKVGRKKNYLYIFYYPDPDSDDKNPITINLSNVFADQMVSKKKNIPVNTCHVRAYISYATSDTIKSILLDLNRCLTLFNSKRDAIQRELYGIVDRKVLDEDWVNECRIGKVFPKKDVEINFSDLYGDYSRSAGIHPTVLEQITKDRYYVVNPLQTENPEYWADQPPFDRGDERIQAIWFPSKKDKERLESSGFQVNSYYFAADNKTKPFIGLTYRPELDPPFSPNTFKDDQLVRKKNSSQKEQTQNTLDSYVDEKQFISSSSPYILKTGKHVNYQKFGEMSPLVNTWMEMIYPGHKLIRYGLFDYDKEFRSERVIIKTERSSNILHVLEYLINGQIKDPISRKRQSMLKYIRQSNLYYTESFKYSREELEDIIINENDDKWLDPLLFYHILRDMYKVELVFFTKKEEKSKSEFYLTCPYFYHQSMAEEYVAYKNYIIITINNGGEFDRHDYPHCEPTFIYSKIVHESDITPSFPVRQDTFKNETDSDFYRAIKRALTELYGKKYKIPRFDESPLSQTLDTMGRVSWLHFKDVSVQMLTPIHSQNIELRQGLTFTNEDGNVRSFMSRQNVKGKTRKIGEKTIGYDVLHEGFRFFIPVGVQEQESALNKYHKYEKTSRYITEYVYYLFSNYVKGKEVTSENIHEYYVRFSREHMVVLDGVYYPMVVRSFYLEGNPYLLKNTGLDFPWQLIITNEVMRRKCMYLLRQFYESYPEILMLYHELKYMPNYYKTILDFTRHPKTIFFQQKANVEYYLKNINNDLEEGVLNIQPNATDSYMLYRTIPELNHSVWLIQPAQSLEHAVYLCEEWRRHHVVKQQYGESTAPCSKIVWETPTSYKMYLHPEGIQRVVCMILTEEGMKYQSCFKYDASYAK